MSQLYEKPLPVGKTGNYTLTVDSAWLDGEPITSQSATVDSGGATVGITVADGNVIQTYLTGVTVGRHEVEFQWATATRSDCLSVFVDVVEC